MWILPLIVVVLLALAAGLARLRNDLDQLPRSNQHWFFY